MRALPIAIERRILPRRRQGKTSPFFTLHAYTASLREVKGDCSTVLFESVHLHDTKMPQSTSMPSDLRKNKGKCFFSAGGYDASRPPHAEPSDAIDPTDSHRRMHPTFSLARVPNLSTSSFNPSRRLAPCPASSRGEHRRRLAHLPPMTPTPCPALSFPGGAPLFSTVPRAPCPAPRPPCPSPVARLHFQQFLELRAPPSHVLSRRCAPFSGGTWSSAPRLLPSRRVSPLKEHILYPSCFVC
jgi:hypothetical protein